MRFCIFCVVQFRSLLCGLDNAVKYDFSVNTLENFTKARQGYTSQTAVVKYLFEILSEYEVKEQRQFIRYVLCKFPPPTLVSRQR